MLHLQCQHDYRRTYEKRIVTVTLTPTNGAINNLTDADANTAGIQLTGAAADINTAIAGATFTATAAGAASIGISVSDGTAAAVTGTYSLTASAPSDTTPPVFQSAATNANGDKIIMILFSSEYYTIKVIYAMILIASEH